MHAPDSLVARATRPRARWLLAAAVFAAGWASLAAASISLAPLLLVLAYLVLVPWALLA